MNTTEFIAALGLLAILILLVNWGLIKAKKGTGEYTNRPNPDFDPDKPESSDTNPRYVPNRRYNPKQPAHPVLNPQWERDEVMADVTPNSRKAFVAGIAIVGIVLALLFTLRSVNKGVAGANGTATNAMNAAQSALFKADSVEAALGRVFGTMSFTNDGVVTTMPAYGKLADLATNAVTRQEVEGMVARAVAGALDTNRLTALETGLAEQKVVLAGLERKLNSLTNNASESVVAGLRQEIANTRQSIEAKAEEAQRIARNALNTKASGGLPDHVAQSQMFNRKGALSFRRLGMFGKHNAEYDYNVQALVRPDKKEAMDELLARFEKDHNDNIVKILEMPGDEATPRFQNWFKAQFNNWVLAKWDYRSLGTPPQIEKVTLTSSSVSRGKK